MYANRAKKNWEEDTQFGERMDILRQMKYNYERLLDKGSKLDWNDLPKYIQTKLTKIYPETLYDEKIINKQGKRVSSAEKAYKKLQKYHGSNPYKDIFSKYEIDQKRQKWNDPFRKYEIYFKDGSMLVKYTGKWEADWQGY